MSAQPQTNQELSKKGTVMSKSSKPKEDGASQAPSGDKYEPEEALKPVEEPEKTTLSHANLTPLSKDNFNLNNAIASWSRVICKGPPKRRSSHSAFLYKQTYLYIVGGVDITEKKQNDIYMLDLCSKNPEWVLIEPKEKKLEKIAYHSGVEYQGIYYIIGGQDASLNSSNHIQKFNINDVEILEPFIPSEEEFPPLESHTSNLFGSKAIIFGGHTNKTYNVNVFEYDILTDKVENLTPNGPDENFENYPRPRQEHAALIKDGSLFIYGGFGPDETYYGDMWQFNLTTKAFIKIEYANKEPNDIPEPRTGATMVEFNGDLYIFGGRLGLIKESNEMWKFHIGASSFELVHDTLIEEFTAEELENTKLVQGEHKKKKPFRLLSRHEVEQRTNPLPYNLKNAKHKKKFKGGNNEKEEANHKKNNSFTEQKNPHSNEVLTRPNVSKMKKSLIYTSTNDELNVALDELNHDEKAMIDKTSVLIQGEVPEPRDGQIMMNFRDSKILVFGGDRNKFPFNDLYYYVPTEGQEEEQKPQDNKKQPSDGMSSQGKKELTYGEKAEKDSKIKSFK